jgi:hypothetical protein
LVNDFLDNRGNLLSFDEFLTKFDINTNFSEYQNIIESNRRFLNQLSLRHLHQKEEMPIQPLMIEIIYSQKKGCRQIYDYILRANISSIAKRKWEDELNLNNDFNWNGIYRLPFNITKDSNLQWFQYKVNHRILATNYL